MIAALLFWVCFSTIAWVYAGYPLLLIILEKLMPRPRRRDPIILPVSVIVVAHNEEAAMEEKVGNILASDYPAGCIEVVVASDGSTDGTVDAARRGGAHIVMDLPRVGKTSAINRAVKRSSGDVLIFTDADFRFEPETVAALVSNFADDSVGGVAGSKATLIRGPDGALARGEGLYWRYDLWVSRLEDRIGSTVSANGFLYAIRRSLFRPTSMPAGSDDVLISTGVIKSGKRLAFDEHSRVLSESRTDERHEFRRKVRLMNRGLRASFSLSRTLPPVGAGFYSLQLFSHKILRRFLPFFLVGLLASSIRLVMVDPSWWASLGPQLAFYGLAGVGAVMGGTRFGRMKPLWIPYYFCLANLAAAVAVISLLRGVRFERWEPVRAPDRSGDPKVEK